MRVSRSLHTGPVAGLAGIILLVGCQGGGPGPSRSLDPSASPIIETDADFCEVLDTLEGELANLRTIRLRPGNRRLLDDQFDELDIAVDDVMRRAPDGMRVQLNALNESKIELGLGVEDYATTNRFAEAADHVYRRELQFDRDLQRLRARTTCPEYAPTPEPRDTPTPAPSPSSSVAPGSSPAPG